MDSWRFEKCFGEFPPDGFYFVEVGFGYTIKYDPLREDNHLTVIGPNGRVGGDVNELWQAIGLAVWDKTCVDKFGPDFHYNMQ